MIDKEALLKDDSTKFHASACYRANELLNQHKELELPDIVFSLLRDAYKEGYIERLREEEALHVVPEDVKKRFFAKVDQSGECWVWKGASNKKNGYGFFRYKGKTDYAHRVAYLIAYITIPDGVYIVQTCQNRLCVRDTHLSTRPYGEHARRAVKIRHGRQKAKTTDEAAPAGGSP